MPRSLLLGGTGQLGTAMGSLLSECIAPTRAELDLSAPDLDRFDQMVSTLEPDLVINCAAYTAVDKAEDEEDLATVVNGEAVGLLAEVTAGHRIPFVTFSTDYVFDGTATVPYVESDDTAPINAYGRSKLVGELLALEENPRTLVVRTSWVISGTHPNFVATMLRLANDSRTLTVVNDQQGRPTVAIDLAKATLEAVKRGGSGILHLTNQGTTTWFELARASLEIAGLDSRLIQSCRSEDYPTPATRPVYSALGSERIRSLGLNPLPNWQASLPDVVAQLISD